MFAYLGDRYELMGHIPGAAIRSVVELGVCKGLNAQWLLTHFEPESLVLVDPWKAYDTSDTPFYFRDEGEGRQSVEDYYGGSVDEQDTFEALHRETTERFAGDERVTILRRTSREAAQEIADASVDIIYIDADHRYEAVLDDLFTWRPKLTEAGYIVLNDHAINASGTAQYGVVQAVNTFLRTERSFMAIAMNMSNYADLIIGRKGVDHSSLLMNIVASGKAFELPDSMISNFHVGKSGNLSWLSFC